MINSWYPCVQDIFLIIPIPWRHRWNCVIYATLSVLSQIFLMDERSPKAQIILFCQ